MESILKSGKLNFVFSNLNAIVLGVWIVFLIIVAIRFFRPAWVKNISFFKLILIALGLNILYGLFVTWGQYYVWANGNEVTKALINSPLPKEAPLFSYLRPLFENHFGYFLYYILGRIWLNILISFLISCVLYFLFRIWKFYRGGFLEQGPEILLILMLIVGFPGVLFLIPIGFIFSILLFGFYYSKTLFKRASPRAVLNLVIEPAFIFATFFTLVFTRLIMLYLTR